MSGSTSAAGSARLHLSKRGGGGGTGFADLAMQNEEIISHGSLFRRGKGEKDVWAGVYSNGRRKGGQFRGLRPTYLH